MTDFRSLLNSATGSAAPTDVDADVARGRQALRNRRHALVARGTFALVLVAGVVVAQNGGAFDGSGTTGQSVVVAPDIAFVAYTGDQPEGFTVTTVPADWKIQGVNEYTLVIAEPGENDTSIDSFTGKLVVMLESLDATEDPIGTAISVGDRDGVVTKPGDGYGMVHWVDASGNSLVVQWPLDTGWSDRDVADFAAGVTVLDAAKPTRG